MQKDNKLMLGYENFMDLVSSAFGTSHLALNITGGFIAAMTTFITQYIWDDSRAIYTLLGIITLDACTGIMRAIKHKTFSSGRLPRILVIMVLYTGLLSIGWNLAKISPFYGWIPSLLYGGFVTTLIISIIENLHQIQAIPDNIYNYIKTKIDLFQAFAFGSSFNKTIIEVQKPSKIGIYQTDISGKLTFANDNFKEIVQLEEDEISTKSLLDMLHPDDKERVIANWQNAIKKKNMYKSEHRINLNNGEQIKVLSQSTPMKDASGKIIGYLGTYEQIS